MEEKLPDNLEEALEYIQKLHSENAKLKETVDKQNIMLSNVSANQSPRQTKTEPDHKTSDSYVC